MGKRPDMYEIENAMDPKDNGTVKFEFKMSLIPGTVTGNILFNSSNFNAMTAFGPTGAQGDNTTGPDGDMDNDAITNYDEYAYGMPEDYNLTVNGPYDGGLSPINCDTDGDGMPDAYETQYDLDPCHNDAAQDADGIT